MKYFRQHESKLEEMVKKLKLLKIPYNVEGNGDDIYKIEFDETKLNKTELSELQTFIADIVPELERGQS